MTERTTRTGVRRYRSRGEAAQLAAEYQASGLTRREFCEQRRVAINTLNRYISRYSEAQPAGAPQLVQVEVAEPVRPNAGVSVVLAGGRRLQLDKGFDAATLRAAVSVLELL
jgi:hypothetical protein